MIKDYALRTISACLFFWACIAVGHAAQLSISAPAQSSTASGGFTVAGNAAGFLNVEVWFDGAEIARATPAASGAFSMWVDASNIVNGTHTFTINAWNSPPHTPFTLHAQESRTITVAQTVSSTAGGAGSNLVTVTFPASEATVSGQMTLSGTATGLQNVEVSFNGILLARAIPSASGAFQATFSTSSLPDGQQTLLVNGWNSPAGQPFSASGRAMVPLNVANQAVNIVDYGAVADGVTDNHDAIMAAIDAAQSRRVSVFVPAGTFAYGDVLTLTGVKMFGVGDASALYALNWANEAIFMYGSGSEVRQLKLTGVTAPGRVAPWQSTRITLFGASNFVIDHVTITGSAAAGIQTASGTNHGIISNSSVSNTLSDSIHMTDNASYIVVENNHVRFSGDDGIAVVSYLSDGAPSNNITAKNNVVQDNMNGRSMSVVGGQNVLYQNNLLERNAEAACLYFAQESGWNTFAAVNVAAEHNSLFSCGNPAIGHGAVMIITTGTGVNNGIQLLSNIIEPAPNGDFGSNWEPGIRVFGSNQNITLNNNEVNYANPAYDIENSGVALNASVSGTVGFTTPVSLPIP